MTCPRSHSQKEWNCLWTQRSGLKNCYDSLFTKEKAGMLLTYRSSRRYLFIYLWLYIYLFVIHDLFIYFILDRGERRGKERERNISVWLLLMCPLLGTWPPTQACALTGNQTGSSLVHRPALNSLSHTSQGEAPLFRNLKLILSLSAWPATNSWS